MAATTYTSLQAVTLATLAPAYDQVALFFQHLASAKRQQNVNIILQAMVVNPDNTISFTFANALPVSVDQLTHLGIAQTS